MGLSKDLQEVAGALARSASHRVQRVQLDDTTVTVNIEGLKEIQARAPPRVPGLSFLAKDPLYLQRCRPFGV